MPYKHRAQQREYQRKWTKKRRETFLEGRCCAHCGSTDRLEVDHIDRSQKVSHNIWSWKPARQKAELAKCQILCYGCHKTKTAECGDLSQNGTTNGNAKLADEDVLAIRRNVSGLTGRELARQFGVHPTTISKVQRRTNWTHLEEESNG